MNHFYTQFSNGSVKLLTPSSSTREWSFGEDAYEDGVDENEDEVEAKDDDEWDEMDQDEDL